MRNSIILATLLTLSFGGAVDARAENTPTVAPTTATQSSVAPSPAVVSSDTELQALKAKWAHSEPAKAETNWLRKQSPEIAQAADASSSWRTVLALLALAGLVTFTWFARQRSKTARPAPSLGNIKVLGSSRIGPKAQIVVAEIAGQTFLLGVTEHQITRLAEVSEPATKSSRPSRVRPQEHEEDPFAHDPIPANGAGRFAEMLKTTLNSSTRSGRPQASDIATDETDDVVSSRSTLRSSRRPPRWNLDEQAAGLFSQLNGK